MVPIAVAAGMLGVAGPAAHADAHGNCAAAASRLHVRKASLEQRVAARRSELADAASAGTKSLDKADKLMHLVERQQQKLDRRTATLLRRCAV